MVPVRFKTSLDDILARNAIHTLLQPIVNLRNELTLGYEALSRGPNGHMLQRPDMMFRAAQQFDKVLELDTICLRTALMHYIEQDNNALLFLNISPDSLLELADKSVELIRDISKNKIKPHQIVLEISERFPIHDLNEFICQLNRLKSLGFSIAIDDLGTGYSGLKLWSEIQPDYVKIDRHFIHKIDQNTVKQSFVSSVVHLCEQLNCEIIAEGIETRGEMDVIRSLGIYLGQGFLLGKPHPVANFTMPVFDDEKQNESTCQRMERKRLQGHNDYEQTVDSLYEYIEPITPTMSLGEVGNIFKQRSDMLSIPVVKNGFPIGLIHRWRVLEIFSAQYGRILHERTSAIDFMQQDRLIFDRSQKIEGASKAITSADDNYLRQHFIVTDKGRYVGIVNTKKLLKSITGIQIKKARYANPLTLLPGNVPIDEHIQTLLDQKRGFSLAYVDLNHFKPFNDQFGYRRGDAIIRWLGKLLEEHTSQSTFVGHVGGDDFVLIFENDRMHQDCQNIINAFTSKVVEFYREGDLTNNYVNGTDRQGNPCRFSILGLAIGGVPKTMITTVNGIDIAALAAKAKKLAKVADRSQFVQL
jgi:EAL domain-containing protein (putative c-di-GMP-specific phosphodiesterase class I)/GGDEF domain-containing protein